MALSIDDVFRLLRAELRAAGYCPDVAELARMRAFLAELDGGERKNLSPRSARTGESFPPRHVERPAH